VNCKQLITELSEYFDESFDPGLRTEIERHITKCMDCRLVVDTTRKTIEIFCKAEPLPLPDDTRQRLRRAIEDHFKRPHT
jgi:hypothetical protein